MNKLNLWGGGFKTETYKVLSFSLFNEMQLSILTDYFKDFMTEEIRTIEDKEVKYAIVNVKKVTDSYKNEDFIDNINNAEQLVVDVLGEDFAKTLSFYNYFFLIPSLYYEIISYKQSLKKK